MVCWYCIVQHARSKLTGSSGGQFSSLFWPDAEVHESLFICCCSCCEGAQHTVLGMESASSALMLMMVDDQQHIE
jgi:hypothetical protein